MDLGHHHFISWHYRPKPSYQLASQTHPLTMAKSPNEEAHLPGVDGDDFRGLVLADVIPRDRKPWYSDWTLWKLNLLLLSGLLTQTATGFDASM